MIRQLIDVYTCMNMFTRNLILCYFFPYVNNSIERTTVQSVSSLHRYILSCIERADEKKRTRELTLKL